MLTAADLEYTAQNRFCSTGRSVLSNTEGYSVLCNSRTKQTWLEQLWFPLQLFTRTLSQQKLQIPQVSRAAKRRLSSRTGTHCWQNEPLQRQTGFQKAHAGKGTPLCQCFQLQKTRTTEEALEQNSSTVYHGSKTPYI